jgi:alkylation response protein AidB-like acyl-CoA dehydrogenase
MSYLDAVLVIEQLARNCAITGRIVVEANMGGVGAVMAYGTDEQKRTVASHVLSGDKPAICITEPEAAVRPRPTCEPPRKGRPAATWSTGRSTGSRAAV